MRKLRTLIIGAALTLIALGVWQYQTAYAKCDITATNGADDIVVCTNPPDGQPLDTGAGNDQVRVEPDVLMETGPNTLDTGSGSDIVTVYGTLRSHSGDPIDMDSGNDEAYLYGVLEGADDGIGCAPHSGEVCKIHNYGSITAVFEAVDYRSEGSGSGYVYNEGTIRSTAQEALHLHDGSFYEIVNKGNIIAMASGVEVFGAPVRLTNYGLIQSSGRNETGLGFPELAVNLDKYDDVVLNYGTISTEGNPGVSSGRGNDVVENYGTVSARNDDPTESVIDTGDGDDRIVSGGNIIETGTGYAAIEAGHGSDVVTIRGGSITGLISGDHHSGGRSGDHDTLIFDFTGDAAAIEAFRQSVAAQSAQGGSATWQGNTYRWAGFEEIQVNGAPTGGGTPPPSTSEPTPEPQCPSDVPPGVTAKRHSPQGDGITFELEWENISDACAAVTSYTVHVARGSFRQEWSFSAADLYCNGASCWGQIVLSQPMERFYWYVTATNALGEGGPDNWKRYWPFFSQ